MMMKQNKMTDKEIIILMLKDNPMSKLKLDLMFNMIKRAMESKW